MDMLEGIKKNPEVRNDCTYNLIPFPSHQIILDFPTRNKVLNHLSISPLGLVVTSTSPVAKNLHFSILLPEN